MQILDASAFIHEYQPNGSTASIPAVQTELEGEHAYRFDAMAGGGMRVHVPDSETVSRVKRAASSTGDAAELSETDSRLLAAAFELNGTLVTDDYAIQNVAERLDIDVEPIARDEIAERRTWTFQCSGCGREFEDHRDRCPVCGSGLSRKNPS